MTQLLYGLLEKAVVQNQYGNWETKRKAKKQPQARHLSTNTWGIYKCRKRRRRKISAIKYDSFCRKGIGIPQAGKGDRQTEVIALTTAIRADNEQEAYLVALSAVWQ